ncbi:MAG: protein-disulfide reductase DsbD N-terminal domain-containing protein, partial [Thermoguttaceae bacterium]|nr:protein-disulfide reductase DsbD N-terminal domain-containing protein [Thermoguttaceae bacterium]
MKQRWWCALAAATVLGLMLLAELALGQQEDSLRLGGPAGLGRGTPDPKLAVTGRIVLANDGQRAQLLVSATIEPGWYIYSITQAPGGPVRTRIRLDPSDDYELAGDWQADPAPVKKKSEAFDGLTVETHSGKVTWAAPIRFNRSVDPSRLKISGAVFAQRCDQDTCLPPRNFAFTARVEAAAAGDSTG